MTLTLTPPPQTLREPVTEVLHGVNITDPYRWLEDQDSQRTREWLLEQTAYARGYLDTVPGRERIRVRIREFLDVETYDSLQQAGSRYVFRKRVPGQEQPSIYLRDGAEGKDQLLIDPAGRRTGKFTAVKPLLLSRDGRLLLYEVKEGGERSGLFELLDVERRQKLPDSLPRGYLHGFAFAPDGKGFYYVHRALDSERPLYRAAYCHTLGSSFREDREIFFAGEEERLQLSLFAAGGQLGLLVYRLLEKTITDFYLLGHGEGSSPQPVVTNADYSFSPMFLKNRIFAVTDLQAPNLRIVEVIPNEGSAAPKWIEVVPERKMQIENALIVGDCIAVSYISGATSMVRIFDSAGNDVGALPAREDQTVRFVWGSSSSDELLFESQSFTEPIEIFRYSVRSGERTLWSKRTVRFDPRQFTFARVLYPSRDRIQIPMYLVGRHDVVGEGVHPTIMTSYGGFGISMTPQFSVFVAFLLERGCLFAMPNIRGGCEFGAEWHSAAKRQNRQKAYDDFLAAAEFLVSTGRSTPERLAIFGGSNSGLLVGTAVTQRPDLFRAVVSIGPLLEPPTLRKTSVRWRNTLRI